MKRIKLTLTDLINTGITYYNFRRIKFSSGERGWSYYLDKPLTDSQTKWLLQWKNVVLGTRTYVYAPEIQSNIIVILDKCRTI